MHQALLVFLWLALTTLVVQALPPQTQTQTPTIERKGFRWSCFRGCLDVLDGEELREDMSVAPTTQPIYRRRPSFLTQAKVRRRTPAAVVEAPSAMDSAVPNHPSRSHAEIEPAPPESEEESVRASPAQELLDQLRWMPDADRVALARNQHRSSVLSWRQKLMTAGVFDEVMLLVGLGTSGDDTEVGEVEDNSAIVWNGRYRLVPGSFRNHPDALLVDAHDEQGMSASPGNPLKTLWLPRMDRLGYVQRELQVLAWIDARVETSAERAGFWLPDDFFWLHVRGVPQQLVLAMNRPRSGTLVEYRELMESVQSFPVRLRLQQIRRVVKPIVNALWTLHERVGLVHGQLRMSSVLLEDENAEAEDGDARVAVQELGGAQSLGALTQAREGILGAVGPWSAPEVLLQKPVLTSKVDLWSLGVLILRLFTGQELVNPMRMQTDPDGPELGAFRELCRSLGTPSLDILEDSQLPLWKQNKLEAEWDRMLLSQPAYWGSVLGQHRKAKVEENPEKSGWFRRFVSLWKRVVGRLRLARAEMELVEFVAGLLHWDPRMRPSAQELLDHPFLLKD